MAMVVTSRSLRVYSSALSKSDYVRRLTFPDFPIEIPVIFPPIKFPSPHLPIPSFPSDSDSDDEDPPKKKVYFPLDPVDLVVTIPERYVSFWERCFSYHRI